MNRNGVGGGKKTDMVEKHTVSMRTGTTAGGSSRINFAVGSGARPGKSKFVTGSSAPADPQMIRPKNVIGS